MALFKTKSSAERMDRDPDASPFMQRGFIASAGLIGVVVLTVAFAAAGGFSSGGGHPKPLQAPAVTATPNVGTVTGVQGSGRPSTSAYTDGGGDCAPLSDTVQSLPDIAPPDIQWTLFREAIALPYSQADGPATVVGGVARCFAHTPSGALLAAAQIDTRLVWSNDWQTVANEQVLAGSGRDVYVANHTAAISSAPYSGPAPGTLSEFAGFRFVNYTPASAVIEMAYSAPSNGGYFSTVLTVVWDAGDWKLQLQPDGSDSSISSKLTDLTGFVPLGGI